ncbi:hypothetical protein NCH01_14000 [Neoasaia chiangmaiensis]|nr:hypothetical protein NCH01_14000 [Neoasaia chiangmaiensis]
MPGKRYATISEYYGGIDLPSNYRRAFYRLVPLRRRLAFADRPSCNRRAVCLFVLHNAAFAN